MGRPVVHWELWSEDPGKVSEFYEKVFDWQIKHVPQRSASSCCSRIRRDASSGCGSS